MTHLPMPGFVHLNIHSEFSLADGMVRVADLVRLAPPAAAITDDMNLFGVVRFYKKLSAAGIKPLIGAQLSLCDGTSSYGKVIALCQDEEGYRNLAQLLTEAYRSREGNSLVVVELASLARTNGLMLLDGGSDGAIYDALGAGDQDKARLIATTFARLFPERFYLEIHRIGLPQEREIESALLVLASSLELPVVATNKVLFPSREDYEAHAARVAIARGSSVDQVIAERTFTPDQYLKSGEQMVELFADLPEALENSVEIARRCSLGLSLDTPQLPTFLSEGRAAEEALLAARAWQLLTERIATNSDIERYPERYSQRLTEEIAVITRMGFSGYFLIVADFIGWAKINEIPVGPGRGSGAGSLVAYALGITDIDPLRYDLLFERFLNPERVSMPDFDVDFCMERRDEVIAYVADKYGRDRVSQIITFGTLGARAGVRDVTRVLGLPYAVGDRVAKAVPEEVGITLAKALQVSPALAEMQRRDPEAQSILELAQRLEGLPRNTSTHAGGVVIAPSTLTDFTPLYQDGGETVTQFDKDDVEAAGLVKFDFLGLRTLTVIRWALEMVKARQPDVSLEAVDIADAQVYALLESGEASGIFQLESPGMRRLIRRLRPDRFEDLIALVALFRPGPLQSGMVEDFINRKQGSAAVEYPHPLLEPILQPTYGVIVYQEQVMQIAQALAGYTLGAADLLRRAMGKKKPEEMAKQRAVFIEGASARGIPKATATPIFDLMEKFAEYGFNKSHSAAYALVSYQTAWLKMHYPAEYLAASCSSELDNNEKLAGFVQEAQRLGIEVLPPRIERSAYRFTVETGAIRFGLGGISGVGESAAEVICAAARKTPPERGLHELLAKAELNRLPVKTLHTLIEAGALDSYGETRASLAGELPQAYALAVQQQRERASGQTSLFGDEPSPVFQTNTAPEWPREELLAAERRTLGLYLSDHPARPYRETTGGLITSIRDVLRLDEPSDVVVTLCGEVADLRQFDTSGGPMAVIRLDDGSGRLEATLFARVFGEASAWLAPGALVVVTGKIVRDNRDETLKLQGGSVTPADDFISRKVQGTLTVQVAEEQRNNHDTRQGIAKLLRIHRGVALNVVIEYCRADGVVAKRIVLPQEWQVASSLSLYQALLSRQEVVRFRISQQRIAR